jgi:murein DD-endopeptidase MepM/ murein hydrolase activator NlpD
MRRCPHIRLGLCILLLAISSVIAAASAAHAYATAEWMWPLDPKPAVLRPFQPPPEPWSAGHRGVDLSARFGQQVRSSGAGVVAFAGLVAGVPVVTVSHGVLRTTYEPVEPGVLRGDRVRPGEVIGRLSRAGAHCSARRPCLHWGLLRGSTYLDPLALFRSGPIRLLPRNASRPGGLGGAPAGTRDPTAADPTAANQAPRDRRSPARLQEPDRGQSRAQAVIVGGSAMALAALAVAARRRLEPGDVPTGSGR